MTEEEDDIGDARHRLHRFIRKAASGGERNQISETEQSLATAGLRAYPTLAKEKMIWGQRDLFPFAVLCCSQTISMDFVEVVYNLHPKAASEPLNAHPPSPDIGEDRPNQRIQYPYTLHLMMAHSERTDIAKFLLDVFPKEASIPTSGNRYPIWFLEGENFTNLSLAKLFVYAHPAAVNHCPGSFGSVLRNAILARAEMDEWLIGEELLQQNEDVIRLFVEVCPESCAERSSYSYPEPILATLLFRSPYTIDLVELVAGAHPGSISNALINMCLDEYSTSADVLEILIRQFTGVGSVDVAGGLLYIWEPCVNGNAENMMQVVIRACDANPVLHSICLEGEGTVTSSSLVEIGQTKSLTNVFLSLRYNSSSSTQISRNTLNAAFGDMIHHNRSIEGLCLGGDFDVAVCDALATGNTYLTSLMFDRKMPNGDRVGHLDENLSEVAVMLKGSNVLRVLELDSVNGDGALSLAIGLKENKGLQALGCVTNNADEQGVEALVETMSKYNTTLRYFVGIDDRLTYYCALNRAGRGALRREDATKDLLAAILQKCNSDPSLVFGILREGIPRLWS